MSAKAPTGIRRSRGDRRRQRGQALSEALVAGIVLVPLVLLIILLGKYQSIQQSAIAASRTLAFECTVRIESCQSFDDHPELIEEIRYRHFAQHGFGLETRNRVTDADDAGQRNALWVDDRNRSLLERFEDVQARISSPSFDAGLSVALGRAGRSVASAARVASELAGPGKFGFDIGSGLFEARVSADLSPTAGGVDFLSQLHALRLRPQAKAAILVDAWNASGPYGPDDVDSVESRVERGGRLNDAAEAAADLAYAPIRGFMELMRLGLLEPTANRFDYHHVDVDRVPADRLGP